MRTLSTEYGPCRLVAECPLGLALCLAAGAFVMFAPAAARLRAAGRALILESGCLRFRLALFCVAATCYGLASILVFDGLPRIDDSVSALFQARIFASGRLYLPVPELGRFFTLFAVLGARENSPVWMTMYPPGWPALLTPGVLLGAPWLVNPMLGACLVVAVAAVAEDWFGRLPGRLAGLLALASPFLASLAASHLSHTATALMLMLCLLATRRLLRHGGVWWGAAAGGSWGVAFLCRPLDALLVGVLIGLWPLFEWRRSLRAWRGVLAAALLAAAAAATLAAWQHVSTGSAWTAGHKAGMGRRGRYGFVRLDHVRSHTPALGWNYTVRRIRVINERLLGWPVPSLLPVLLPFLLRCAGRQEWWLLGPWLGLLAAYMGYWYWEEEIPARYTSAGAPMLVVLAARGCAALDEVLASRRPGLVRPVHALGLAMFLFGATAGIASVFGSFGPNFFDVENCLAKTIREAGITNAVVFMGARGVADTDGDAHNDFYATGFMRNTLALDGDIVYARDLGRDNAAMIRAYPGRRYYLYTFFRDSGRAEIRELGPDAALIPRPAAP